MDIKSMAKSKRSHTKQNQPRKPNQNPPKPTSSNPNPNPSNLTKNKPKLAPQKPSLPSNWDRYDHILEDGEQESEFVSPYDDTGSSGPGYGSTVKKAVDGVVILKSKGADYKELIAQAKDSNQHYYSPSFRDNLDDFYQGLVPMLEGRSEGIPSWDRDDDFLLENETATSEEAPNFSLDLKALAEDLAKANLAKRLFIEPDLFPPELCGLDSNEVDSQGPEKRLTTFETFEELYSIYLADEKIAETEEVSLSSLNESRDFKTEDMPQQSQVTKQDSENRLDDVGREISHITDQGSILKSKNMRVLDHREPPLANDGSKQNTLSSTNFVADVAESELDMLLNSFSDSNTSVSNFKGHSVTHEAPLPHSRDASRLPAHMTSNLNDDFDDLLDTSSLSKKYDLFESVEVKIESTDNERVLGLSRSAFPVSSSSLDDELDNLLEETSKPMEVNVDSSGVPSSSSSTFLHPGSKPKAVDDFDSWLDTL